MSAIPAAVQAQYERSQALEKKGQQAPEPTPDTPTPEVVAEPAKPAPEPTVDWEQRYNALQGKYNAEVPRYADQLKDFKQKLDEAKTTSDKHLREAQELRQAQASAQTDSTLKRLEDDYDPDGVVSMLKALREENASLQQKLVAMESDVGALKTTEVVRNQNIGDDLMDEVRKAVPNLDAINQNPAFSAWCKEVDEQVALVTGVRRTRQDVFDEVSNTVRPETLLHSARRAAALYQQWERDNGNVQQALSSQLTPSDTAVDRPSSQAGEVWGPRSADAFYLDRRKGKFRGRDQEAQALDRSLTTAMQDGRWDPRQ